jgi:hypothetical protein
VYESDDIEMGVAIATEHHVKGVTGMHDHLAAVALEA